MTPGNSMDLIVHGKDLPVYAVGMGEWTRYTFANRWRSSTVCQTLRCADYRVVEVPLSVLM
jgi:hypothetical protein